MIWNLIVTYVTFNHVLKRFFHIADGVDYDGSEYYAWGERNAVFDEGFFRQWGSLLAEADLRRFAFETVWVLVRQPGGQRTSPL